MRLYPLRKALSMIEVTFVIVILGIVSSIGAEVIANVYENYLVQRAQYRASIKAQLALNQISNRLRHVIPNSIGRRVGTTGTFELGTQALGSGANTYTVLQWVGTDQESFEAIRTNSDRVPGWSGILDLATSTQTALQTPASNFTLTNTIQSNLGRTSNQFAVYFPADLTAHMATATGSTITLNSATPRIVERYKIAWSSYALSVENGHLWLYSNFDPSIGATIGGTRTLMLRNVTNFKFQTRGDTTRIKICVNENIGGGVQIPSCKEKAVF
jgi:hypothetical protein